MHNGGKNKLPWDSKEGRVKFGCIKIQKRYRKAEEREIVVWLPERTVIVASDTDLKGL